jgi:hypothetical protein
MTSSAPSHNLVLAGIGIVVSADGKNRTITSSGTDAKGNDFKSTAVYDKQ